MCKSCHSNNQSKFGAEICIHSPGLKGMEMPVVLLFPTLVVCLDCGFTEFSIPESQLRSLTEGGVAS